jgi:hypothetical protein
MPGSRRVLAAKLAELRRCSYTHLLRLIEPEGIEVGGGTRDRVESFAIRTHKQLKQVQDALVRRLHHGGFFRAK